jgi:hypothetical protein
MTMRIPVVVKPGEAKLLTSRLAGTLAPPKVSKRNSTLITRLRVAVTRRNLAMVSSITVVLGDRKSVV